VAHKTPQLHSPSRSIILLAVGTQFRFSFRMKRPVDDDWQRRVLTEATAAAHFNSGPQNIGVILGPTSNGLTDIDLDCPEAIAIAPSTAADRGHLWTEVKAVVALARILRAVGDPEWRDRLRAVRRSCASGRDRARLWTAEAEGAAREGRC